MFGLFKEQRRERWLAENPLPDALWPARSPLLRGLNAEEVLRLRQLTAWFLKEKAITPVAGLAISDEMRVAIAMQAALPTLNLGFDALDGWHEVVLYPEVFRARDIWQEMIDGHLHLEHEVDAEMAGQARPDGPVLLSWADAEVSPWLDGWNVVIHEIAHKLDMVDGSANGCPPLHKEMDPAAWKAVFAAAFDDLCAKADTDEDCEFDLYAATDPAEFFAVCSEYFFELPHVLIAHYPAVYEQLRQFYRQDPAQRLTAMRYRPILPELLETYERML